MRTMPYAESRGFRIYYEEEGQGQSLVLAHGGSDSHEMWRKYGYTDSLKESYRLVVFDFLGHGKSDKPREESAYGPHMAEDILAILDTLGIEKAHFYGYSLGGMAGFYLAVHHPDRFSSFLLGGVSPYTWPEEMITAVNISIDGYRLRLSDPEAYIRQMEQMLGKEFSPEARADLLAGDAESAMAVLLSLLDWPPLSDRELAGIETPCVVYCGDQDPFYAGAQKSVQYLPRARFLSMDGFNHISAFVQSEVVLPYVQAFFKAVSRVQ